LEWRQHSSYAADLDFLFPSVRFKGNKPLSPDSILEERSSDVGTDWESLEEESAGTAFAIHSRRISGALGVDIEVAQELMRHSSCRRTLDVYTRAVDQQQREANLKVVALMLSLDVEKFQHPSAPSDTQKETRRCRRTIVKAGVIWWT
jgi:integrase